MTSASASACGLSVEASETDAAAAAAAAATASAAALASITASGTALRGSAVASFTAPRPPDGVSLYPFTSPTGSSSSRCNGAPLATAGTMADQSTEEQQIARALRSSDLGSSCKSNAEHASSQFTSLMGSNHGINGHSSSQADLAQGPVVGAGQADRSSTYPSAEVVRVEAADGTLGAMEQDSADMEPFTGQSCNHVEVLCGKAQNLSWR